MKKVYLTEPIHEKGRRILKEKMEVVESTQNDQQTIAEEISECEAVIIRISKITGDIIRNSPHLKIIAKHGVGLDKIDVDTATKHNIAVVNTPQANVIAVAEHAVTMIFALAKNLLKMDNAVREDKFEMRDKVVNMELKGKTVGIVGVGSIGMSMAKMLSGFEVNILAYDPYINESEVAGSGIDPVENIEDIYLNSDIISVHVPLNESTEGMIGKNDFAKMKDSALFINASRGEVIKEKELYQALKNGEIKGAGLDVFAKEPPENDNPLFKLDNVIVSPHNAALTEEALIKMATQSAQGILDFFNGKKPEYIVNPEVLE